MALLTNIEILQHLGELPDWQYYDQSLAKDFVFKDHNEAFAFLTRIAMLSEKMDHHANYSGVYNKLSIRLNSHDEGGVTSRDVKMAALIEGFL